MKPGRHLVVCFFFLALVSVQESILAEKESVVDEGVFYRTIFEADGDASLGGLDLARLPMNGSCSPLLVYLTNSITGLSNLVQFWQVKPKPAKLGFRTPIGVSTDVDIWYPSEPRRSNTKPCTGIRKWQIQYDEHEKQYFVVSIERKGRSGWFRIEKLGTSYYLRFCWSKRVCRNVGMYIMNGLRRLALTDVPLKVTFSEVVIDIFG